MGKTNKILYVMSGQNFQDEEYFESKKIFENAGYKTGDLLNYFWIIKK